MIYQHFARDPYRFEACAMELAEMMVGSVVSRDISRLISRLRHRQFGILVTTSYLALQAYKEIKEDEHPVVIISAVDIVAILRAVGLGVEGDLRNWLMSF